MGIDVGSERNLGLWGSILALLGGFIPYLGSVLALVGFILVLVALKGIGDKVKDDRPFKYYLFAFIAGVAMLILLVFAIFGSLFAFSGMGVHEEAYWGEQTIEPGESMVVTHEVGGFPLLLAGAIFLVVVLIAVVVAYFEMKTWGAMYEITGTKEFGDASTWFKWGAITAIVIVGFLLMFIARIFVILGFSNMPKELEEKPSDIPIDSPVV